MLGMSAETKVLQILFVNLEQSERVHGHGAEHPGEDLLLAPSCIRLDIGLFVTRDVDTQTAGMYVKHNFIQIHSLRTCAINNF